MAKKLFNISLEDRNKIDSYLSKNEWAEYMGYSEKDKSHLWHFNLWVGLGVGLRRERPYLELFGNPKMDLDKESSNLVDIARTTVID
jgi:hypothetical protein